MGTSAALSRGLKFDKTYYDSLTDRVTEAEEKTAADLVVVVRPCSGSYRDVDYLFGAVAAWLGLLLVLFSPRVVHVYAVPLELAGLFAAAAWVSSVTPLRRWLTTRRRRECQVKAAAMAAFVEEGVSHTRLRAGVLVYWSVLERHAEVIADDGVPAAVPPGEWNAFLFDIKQMEQRADPAAALLEDVRGLGRLLARFLPARETSPHELPNRPRVGS